jgi:hypothetical protein
MTGFHLSEGFGLFPMSPAQATLKFQKTPPITVSAVLRAEITGRSGTRLCSADSRIDAIQFTQCAG